MLLLGPFQPVVFYFEMGNGGLFTMMLPMDWFALSCPQQVCQRTALFRHQPSLMLWDATDKPKDTTGPGTWCAENPHRSGSNQLLCQQCPSTEAGLDLIEWCAVKKKNTHKHMGHDISNFCWGQKEMFRYIFRLKFGLDSLKSVFTKWKMAYRLVPFYKNWKLFPTGAVRRHCRLANANLQLIRLEIFDISSWWRGPKCSCSFRLCHSCTLACRRTSPNTA